MNFPRHRQLSFLSRVCLVAVGVVGAVPVAHAAGEPEVFLSGGWDSAYVSEGRDNLGDGGLVSGSVDVAWKGFAFAGWAAHGDSVNYRETNVGVGYSFAVGAFGMSISYTRLEFGGVGEAPGDNEFALGLSVPIPGAIELGLGGRYSTEAEGTFCEVFARRPWETGRAGIIVAPYVLLGYDYGYATHEHDGANHIEGGLSVECPLGDGAMFSVYCARCWAQRDVHLDGGDDVTWGGVRLALRF